MNKAIVQKINGLNAVNCKKNADSFIWDFSKEITLCSTSGKENAFVKIRQQV